MPRIDTLNPSFHLPPTDPIDDPAGDPKRQPPPPRPDDEPPPLPEGDPPSNAPPERAGLASAPG